MANEAFARVKIEALLAAQGWDTGLHLLDQVADRDPHRSDMPGAYHAAVRSVAAKVKVANGQRKIIEIHEHAH